MNLKRLKKIFCGLLAGTGFLSSGVSNARQNDEIEKVIQNLDENDITKLQFRDSELEDSSNWKKQLKALGIRPIDYVPNEEILPLDLNSSTGFETKRLLIEKLTEKEVPSLVNIYDEFVYRRISNDGCMGAPLTDEAKLNGVKQFANSKNAYSYIVKDKETKTPVGEVTIYFHGNTKSFDLSYWFGKDFRGKGYASELIPMICKKMFVREDVNSLSFRILDDNIPSLKIKDKVFNSLNNIYPNQALDVHIDEDHSTDKNIHVYSISKFNFDFNKLVQTGSLMDIDGGIQMIQNFLADNKNNSHVPEDIKNKMSQILDILIKEKQKNPLSFIYTLMLEFGENIQINILNSSEAEALIYVSPNVKNTLSKELYFEFSKYLLCGSNLNRLELKFHNRLKNSNLFSDLKNCLKNDASKKILNLTSEKDENGEEHIYLSKKN